MEIKDLVTIIREDYLDDTFSGWESASSAERDDQFLWSDAALLRYINEAQRQACNRTDFLFDDETFAITLVAGSPSYSISNQITRIEQVTLDGSTVVHKSKLQLEMDHPKWRTDTGISGKTAEYTVRGRKLRVYPIPDAVDAGKVITLDTYRLPLESITSINDELEIPEEFHRDLIWWVLYEAYSKHDIDAQNDEDGTAVKRGLRFLSQFENVFGPVIDSRVRLHQLQEDKSSTFAPIDYIKGSVNVRDEDPQSVWNN